MSNFKAVFWATLGFYTAKLVYKIVDHTVGGLVAVCQKEIDKENERERRKIGFG